MKEYYAYIRVSTVKQGEQGTSLDQQRDAINAYAARNGLCIGSYFEEVQTAAKEGRRVFMRMITELRRKKATGVILHKIDRGARNLWDWASLQSLIDQGVEVHFAHENIDLSSRSGRLSADIQAVVAADYVRNLRDELRKGFYGRLKQGFYPLRAPIGYLDCGRKRPKEPHPQTAPLVRNAFSLYATGAFNLKELREELYQRGFRRVGGAKLSLNGLSTLLGNPFYIGLIHIRRTNQTFQGLHTPLVSKSLFDRVQAILRGKTNTKVQKHTFLFRRLVRCEHCGYALSGERQKGHVYYRCHTQSCPKASLREEMIDDYVRAQIQCLRLTDDEADELRSLNECLDANWQNNRAGQHKTLRLQLSYIESRLSRIVDAYLDGAIDPSLLEEKKRSLLLERQDTEEKIAKLTSDDGKLSRRIADFLEFTQSLSLSYETAVGDEKRELLETFTSNLTANGKSVAVKLRSPFREVIERENSAHCGEDRGTPRTDIARLFDKLVAHFSIVGLDRGPENQHARYPR